MENLVKFPLANGECVMVQIDPSAAGAPSPAANKPGMMREAMMGFEEAAAKLRPIALGLLEQVKDLGPDETRLEFTVGFCAEAGLILAKAGADGHCKLRMTWKQR